MSKSSVCGGISKLFTKAIQHRSRPQRANLVVSYMSEHGENSNEKPHWRKDDVASYCGVGTRTVENWMTHEGLPHIKIGHVVRFKPQDVKDFLEGKRRVVRD